MNGWDEQDERRKMKPKRPSMNENDDYVTSIRLEKGIFISNSGLSIGLLKHTKTMKWR